uniref:Uncharacterized protein n=1 Tax=Plectus sambesii TaxID=2011161 RepID=A0A914WY45_9BILA
MDDMMASPPAHLQGSVNDAFDNQHKDDPFLTQTGQEITEVADKVHDKAERLVEEIFDAPHDKHPDVPGALPEHRKETDFPTEDHIFDNIDPVSPSGDSGRDVIGEMMTSGDDSPMGGGGDFRGVSPDERTYERDGPLTFGHHQTTNAADAVDDFVQQHHPVADPFSTSGFGSEPHQPHLPTENVRHPVGEPFIDLGPPSHPTHVSPPSTPTVKTTVTTTVKKTYGEGSGPWFDFKSVDSRGKRLSSSLHAVFQRINF